MLRLTPIALCNSSYSVSSGQLPAFIIPNVEIISIYRTDATNTEERKVKQLVTKNGICLEMPANGIIGGG